MPSRPRPVRPAAWQDIVAEQGGVLARQQALRAGLSEHQWDWRLANGRWQTVLPGVVATHSGEVSPQQRTWASVLYAGSGACLTGDAALVEHGMRLPAWPVVDVAVPEARKVAPRAFADAEAGASYALHPTAGAGRPASPRRRGVGGWSQAASARPTPPGGESRQVAVEFHRLRDLDDWRHPARRPAVVRVAPAVLHAAAWAPSDRAAEWRVAAAVQQRLVLPGDLRTALASMPRLPRRRLLDAVLEDVTFGAHAGSELDFLRFLRLHRLPKPDRLQRPVRAGSLRYLDAWWERRRINAELDGAHHRSVATWDEDVLRANDVQVAERHDRIVLLRFTIGNLRHDGLRVAAQLRAVLL